MKHRQGKNQNWGNKMVQRSFGPEREEERSVIYGEHTALDLLSFRTPLVVGRVNSKHIPLPYIGKNRYRSGS